MKGCLFFIFFFCGVTLATAQNNKATILQFVFTSDAHYGVVRPFFRGQANVTGQEVNLAMLQKINSLPTAVLPEDGGVAAGKTAGPIDFIVEGGDIANRMEIPVQSATISWQQFEADYLHKINLTDHAGKPTQLMIISGNHDITNAIGHYKTMSPKTDASSMAGIYNLMMKPDVALTKESYQYNIHKIHYSKNIGGIHFMFINLWPDSAERIWMKKDLRKISRKKPVIIFSHDQPESEAKHFSNPNNLPFNATDKFENLLTEHYKDFAKAKTDGGKTALEQTGWERFIKRHGNIKAYFHGNSNWNQFYEYTGIKNEISLHVFRVDSPMKGKYSAKDETRLSFHVVTIDTLLRRMTVRECLWNTEPKNAAASVQWGESKTVTY